MAEITSLVRNANWFSTADEDTDVAISSRARLSRNLADHVFPAGAATPQAPETPDGETPRPIHVHSAAEASTLIGATVRAELMPDIFDAESLEIEPRKLEPEATLLLAERRLVGEPLPDRLFVTSDESTSITIGAVDHLRISTLRHGIRVEAALTEAQKVDKILEQNLHYAVSMDLGYLSTSILNLGSAARVSVLVHLPALSRLGRVDELQHSIHASDFDLIPDEQFTVDDGESAVFRLSNRRTLGYEEEALAAKLEDHARALVHYERVAREELVKTSRSALADEAYRALGILSFARKLGADETLTMLGALRLGIVAELVTDVAQETATSLFFLSRDHHVAAAMRRAGVESGSGEENIQTARARLIREALAV